LHKKNIYGTGNHSLISTTHVGRW